MNNTGFGYGKIILFGEHFVVHGLPALVMALPQKTIASITVNKLNRDVIIDNRPKVATFKKTKTDKYAQLLKNIKHHLNINQSLNVELAGNLQVSSGGIGASAATAVAITRALNNIFDLKLTNNEINHTAWHGECGVHGTPSGIDNTAATFGGTFIFQKDKPTIPCSLPKNMKLKLIDSGHVSDTKTVIEHVVSFKKNRPQEFNKLLTTYDALFVDVKDALKENNILQLGSLMNTNHTLLQQLGVSTDNLDQLIIHEQQHCYGAKLTGTGRGGVIISLQKMTNLLL